MAAQYRLRVDVFSADLTFKAGSLVVAATGAVATQDRVIVCTSKGCIRDVSTDKLAKATKGDHPWRLP